MLKYTSPLTTADDREYKNGHQEQLDLHAAHRQQCLFPQPAPAHWALHFVIFDSVANFYVWSQGKVNKSSPYH